MQEPGSENCIPGMDEIDLKGSSLAWVDLLVKPEQACGYFACRP